METRGKKRKNSGLNEGPDQKIKTESQSVKFLESLLTILDDGSESSSNANLTLEDSKCREAGHESKILLLEQKILELESKMEDSKCCEAGHESKILLEQKILELESKAENSKCREAELESKVNMMNKKDIYIYVMKTRVIICTFLFCA